MLTGFFILRSSCRTPFRQAKKVFGSLMSSVRINHSNKLLPVNVLPKGRKTVGVWLGICAGMVWGAVELGGVTRLTESGLSMVDWDLIKGMRPPIGEAEWQAEFEKYKQFPQFEFLDGEQEMSLKDFKFIWRMEYIHRMWGRAIGLVFFIPAAAFWYKGFFSSSLKKRIPIFGGLLVFQGLLGWYMVKSGLKTPSASQHSDMVPRVSHYRLAAHLGSALLLYVGLLWSSLNQFLPVPQPTTAVKRLTLLRILSHNTMALVFVTALTGAFVAGLDAGLLYNQWPKMGDGYVPPEWLEIRPKWRNFLDNSATVQFVHRWLGATTAIWSVCFAFMGSAYKIPPRALMAAQCMGTMGIAQATMGIYTLLWNMPVWLATSHQSGSVALLSFACWLAFELRKVR